jgi:hypothetical protein
MAPQITTQDTMQSDYKFHIKAAIYSKQQDLNIPIDQPHYQTLTSSNPITVTSPRRRQLLTYVAAHAGPGVGRYDDALVEDESERGRAPLVLHHVLGRRLEPVELFGRKKKEANAPKESAQTNLTDPGQGGGHPSGKEIEEEKRGIGFSRRRSWGTPWLACRRHRRRRGGRRLRRRGRRTESQGRTCPASSLRRRRGGAMDRVR